MKARAVMFDLDGTLVHSGPDLALAANRMLSRMNLPTHAEESIFGWLGSGAGALVKRALTGELEADPDPDLFERGCRLFFEYYRDGLCDRTVSYPNVEAVLGRLLSDGFKLACVTNKPEAFTLPLLRALRLEQYFQQVVCGDSLPKKKPDPMPLNYICDQFDIGRDAAVMVGDSISDIQAAKAAEMPVIFVSYGYNQGLDLTKARPEAIIDSFEELLALIEYQR